jgi:hypothetical protein
VHFLVESWWCCAGSPWWACWSSSTVSYSSSGRDRCPSVSVADPGCLSRIRLFSIPDPNCLHPGSASKNLSILTPKKWFLSSRKYDLGCSSGSRIRMLTFCPSRIPDPGVKKAPDPGSATLPSLHVVLAVPLLGFPNDKLKTKNF